MQVTLKNNNNNNRFTVLFPRPPRWGGARRELLDFMVQGKINRGRHNDHPAGRHSTRTNQCPPPPSPHIFYGPDALPALPPSHKCQATEIKIITTAKMSSCWIVITCYQLSDDGVICVTPVDVVIE